MTDEPWYVSLWCNLTGYATRYSNITWGTGYESLGGPVMSRTNQQMGWDNAKYDYYIALTSIFSENHETYLAKTFQALGQVLHLLQDVAVPAHVRNDFRSHLEFIGFQSIDPTTWFGNLYEHYVMNHPGFVSIQSDPPSFANPRITDFWDTDQFRKGDPPPTNVPLGLAEVTNANYFSDNTIPNNHPGPKHRFVYPLLNSTNYRICEDYAPDSNDIVKYISRKQCPPLSQERSADHFAAISFLNEESSITSADIPFLQLEFDDNVHNTYAKELVPMAVGYSAGLLEYFFRGQLQVTAVPIFCKDSIIYLRAKIKNMTSDETMTDGTFTLTYSYRPTGGKSDGSEDIWGQAPVVSSGTLVYDGEEIAIDFWLPYLIPKENYDSAKFTLAFKGKLGSEEGAVIGKALTLGEIKFTEEWDNGFTGNHNWAHTDFNLFDQNLGNGRNSNVIDGDTLIKDNIRFVGHKTARVNESFLDYDYNNGQFRDILPIQITPDTYLQFKIDAMSINEIPPAPPGYTNHWQTLILHFNNGLTLQYFQEGQGLYTGSKTAYLTFPLGLIIVDNIYEVFKGAGITIPEPLYLESIDFLQQLFQLEQPSTVQHHQHMEVDSIWVIEGKQQ